MTYTGLSKTSYQLASKPIASGGEGDVFQVIGRSVFQVISRSGRKVAKIYHTNKLTHELESKLKYMMNNPPDQSVLKQVAWPLDILYDSNNKFCGFVMPELSINAELKDVYQYPATAGLSNRQKIVIASNICAVISAVHHAGYVFGDFNPRNIGVNKNTGKVAFLDTDSYHVFDKATNEYYRCKVCLDGYVAPELLEACSNHAASNPADSKQLFEKTPLPTFTKETDNFALAIHIFKLLMNGFTPFGGIIETTTPSQASPGMGNAAIRRNEYSFRPGYKPMSAAVPPLDILPQEIVDLFTKAFLVVDTVNPLQRPTSLKWHDALSRYEVALKKCSRDKLHQYDRKNKVCPYCEADTRYQQAISGIKPLAPTVPTPKPLPDQIDYSKKKKLLVAIILGCIGLVVTGAVRMQSSRTAPAEYSPTQPAESTVAQAQTTPVQTQPAQTTQPPTTQPTAQPSVTQSPATAPRQTPVQAQPAQVAVTPPQQQQAPPAILPGLQWQTNNNAVTITSYTGTIRTVTIPSTINGMPVTVIGDSAFCNTQLTSVTIPNSVITIENEAFCCNQLTNVIIPNSVTTIGNFAFFGNQLTSVTIPNSVTAIGFGAFSHTQLTSVTIPNRVTTIGFGTFSHNQLTSITIPNSVTTIEGEAFYNNRLTSITIGANVNIADNAFDNRFVAFYNAQGRRAGTYTFSNGNWRIQ